MTRPAAVEGVERWLADTGSSLNALALKAGVSHSRLWRVMHGEHARVTVEFAARIEEATEGAVPVGSWVVVGS